MEYIVISSKDKSETNFFINLFKKMNKKAARLTTKEIKETITRNYFLFVVDVVVVEDFVAFRAALP